MLPPTPKFRSKAFKEAMKELKQVFDAHSLGVVILDALDRRASEGIYGRFARGHQGSRAKHMQRTELAGQLVTGFFNSDEVAFHIIKEMDRGCSKERHIVASIPEGQAAERIGSYRALALERERAKFVWALARDAREPIRELANRVISEFFQVAAEVDTATKVIEGDAKPSALDRVDMAKRLKEQAEQMEEAATRLSDLESKLHGQETERATLLAKLGTRERTLREELEVREELEAELAELKAKLPEPSAAPSSDAEDEELKKLTVERDAWKSMADERGQKIRRLEKLAGASEKLGELQQELETVQRAHQEAEREQQKERERWQGDKADDDARHTKDREQTEELRAELKKARQRLAEIEPLVPREQGGEAQGIAIFLDQANLAASAYAAHKRKVNFQALLGDLAQGRKVQRALAFVVDNGGSAFDSFCDTLRRAGWELRLKKPKVFADGKTKADWDMGIAVEAIEGADRVETVVLVSGDGDFAPLVRLLRRRGRRVEVAAFATALSHELREAADAVTQLDTRTLE